MIHSSLAFSLMRSIIGKSIPLFYLIFTHSEHEPYSPAGIYNFESKHFGDSIDSLSSFGWRESRGIVWSTDSRYFVEVVAGSPLIKIYDAVTYAPVLTLRSPDSGEVTAAAWKGDYLAIGDAMSHIEIWDVQDVNFPNPIRTYNGKAYSLAWSPDGDLLASGAGDIVIINSLTGKVQQTFYAYMDALSKLVWNRSGRFIASGSLDHTIRVWDVQTGQEVAQFPVYTELPAFDWSADGSKLVYAAETSGGDTDPLVVFADIPPLVSTAVPAQTAAP